MNQQSLYALEKWRRVGDPPADEAARAVFALGGAAAIDEVMQDLVRHDGIPVERLPEPFVRFLDESRHPPPWLDNDLLLRGQDFFLEHGLLGLGALLLASLPECYLMEKGIRVLWATQQLEAHVFRRLIETAQMVQSVMKEGGVRLGDDGHLTGEGVVIAQKVRIMHAAVRRMILHPVPAPATDEEGETTVQDISKSVSEALRKTPWNEEELGTPLNQEDLAYTLLTFGLVIPRALRELGVPVDPRDAEAFLHTWNVVGWTMGVVPELIAHDLESADALYREIQRTQSGGSPQAAAMTAALLQIIREVLPGPLRWLAPVTMRHLIGGDSAEKLGIPRPSALVEAGYHTVHALLALIGRVEHVLLGNSTLRRLSIALGGRIVDKLSHLQRGPRATPFQIDEHFARAWNR